MSDEKPIFRARFYAPDGTASQVFHDAADVPGDWLDHPAEAGPEPVTAKFAALDADGDGKPGGSPKLEQTDELVALRGEYKRLLGKKPFNGWDAVTLREKIAAAS